MKKDSNIATRANSRTLTKEDIRILALVEKNRNSNETTTRKTHLLISR